MPNQLSPEEKKARRAETNRQNAKKSTGPKSEAGKAISRLNGVKNGTRAIVINLSHAPGIALLTDDDTAEYQGIPAHPGPRNRLEAGIIQRIIDAQWRLLRNSRLQSLEMETALEEARENEHPGLPPAAVAEMQAVAANRTCIDAKYIRQLQREEASLMRLINASHRELQSVRKLNPSPAPPVRPRLEYTGEKQCILDRTMAEPEISNNPQPVVNTKESAPADNDRSQPAPGWNYTLQPIAKPKTFAAGAGPIVEANPAHGFPVSPW
jgi:hypothetical protein